jgi:esterase
MELSFKKLGKGTPLVILHGLYGSGDNWHTIGKLLSDRFEVFLVDQRNHGRSPHSSDHTYPGMQEDLLEFYNCHKISKAILMGHSMGGKTAMLFSMNQPERVHRLIIVDIAPKEYKDISGYQNQIKQHLQILQAFKSVDLENFQTRHEIEKEFLKYVPDSVTGSFLLKNLKRIGDNKFKWVLNLDAIGTFLPHMLDGLEMKNTNSEESLPAFRTLFVKGENSNYILEEDKSRINKIFHNAEFVTIFNSGHLPHIEQPESFLASIKYFLEC